MPVYDPDCREIQGFDATLMAVTWTNPVEKC
jgi:hypothetical protein